MSRQDGKLQDGIQQPVRHEARGFAGGPVDLSTMALICQGGGTDSWLLSIFADTGVGMTLLGRIRTLPWRAGRRTVAICAHPGARAWEVTGRRIVPTASWPGLGELPIPGTPAELTDNDRLGIWMTSTRQIGGEWGIKPIRGFAERAVTYKTASGIQGAFTITGNVIGWSARNDNGADGSVVVNNNGPIVVAANGGVVRGSGVPYLGYDNYFKFAGTSEYLIEYELEDPVQGAGE